MPTQYLILENRQLMDDGLYDHEGAVKASVWAAPKALILAFDLDEVIRDKVTTMRVATEDIVLEANRRGLHDDPEFDRRHLAGDYIKFMESRSEALANRADLARKEREVA